MTDYVIEFAVANAFAVTLLAGLAAVLSCVWRNPRFSHALWLTVLLKFLIPPFVTIGLFAIPSGEPVARLADEPLATNRAANGQIDQASETYTPEIANPHRGTSTISEAVVTTAAASTYTVREGEFQDETGCVNERSLMTRLGLDSAKHLWKTLLVASWFVGIATCTVVTVVRIRRFRKFLKRTSPAASWLREEVKDVAHQLALSRVPEVRVISASIVPFVAAIGRPILIFSRQIETWPPGQRQAVMAHELAHLRRRDHLVRWLETIVRHIYWWHPVAYLASTRIHRSAEICCDSLALTTLRATPAEEAKSNYVDVMLKMIDLDNQPNTSPAIGSLAFGEGRFLVRRFEMILGNPVSNASTITHRTLLVAIALALPLSLVSVTATPTSAETEPVTPAVAAQTPRIADGMESPDDLALRQPADEETAAKALDAAVSEVVRKAELFQSSRARVEAGKQQCRHALAKYAAGEMTIDLVLDAQRRLADSEIEYVRAALDSEKEDSVRARLLLELQAIKNGRNSALAVWQLVYSGYLSSKQSIIAMDLAQAKEQYFLFRGQLEQKQQEIARAKSRSSRD